MRKRKLEVTFVVRSSTPSLPLLHVENATKNASDAWVAAFTRTAGDVITISVAPKSDETVDWSIAPADAVGQVNSENPSEYQIPLDDPANVLTKGNTIRVTATAAGITRTVKIIIQPEVLGLTVVPDHYAFPVAENAWYGLDLTRIVPAAANLTCNLEVQTNPANAEAWSHIEWTAINTARGGAPYSLTRVDAQHRGIRLDGVRTIETRVQMPDSRQVMPAAVTIDIRNPAIAANLANDLGIGLDQFTFAGAGRFDVIEEAGARFNTPYPAGWSPANPAEPQGYAASTAFAANPVKIIVTNAPTGGPTNVTLRASAYFPQASGALTVLQGTTERPVAIPSGTPVNATFPLGNITLGNVPNEVMHLDPLLIFWEASDNGGTTSWSPLQLSANPVYVTAQVPVATTRRPLNRGGGVGNPVRSYHSLLQISCRAASGQAGGAGNADAVRDAIYGVFNPANPNPNVVRLNPGGAPMRLKYWHNRLADRPPTPIAQTLNRGGGNLFTVPNGNLACGVWAQMLIAMWAMHGLGLGRLIGVVPRGPNLKPPLDATANVVARTRFLVRRWDYNNHGALNPGNYTHTIIGALPFNPANNQAVSLGSTGQNNGDAPPQFRNHYIVRDGRGGLFYDPSYGTQALNRNDWVDASLAGLRNDNNGTAGFVQVNGALPSGIQPNPASVALYDYAARAWIP